jgi:hypothetical protein
LARRIGFHPSGAAGVGMTVQRRLPFELDKHFAIVTNLPDPEGGSGSI